MENHFMLCKTFTTYKAIQDNSCCCYVLHNEKDLKRYEDGSFRLYFKTTDEPEIAYFQLVKMAEKGFDYRQISQS
jgi:hypothetical protein